MEDTLTRALERASAILGRAASDLGAEFAAVVLDPEATGTNIRQRIVHRWSVDSGTLPGEPSGTAFVHRWTVDPLAVAIALDFPGRPPLLRVLPASVAASLDAIALTFWSAHEIGKLRAELKAAGQRLAGRKLVERAKGVLQLEQGLTEESAYAFLRGQSRSRRITLTRLAEEVIRGRAGRTHVS